MGIDGFDADLFDAAEFGDVDWIRSAVGSVGVDGKPIDIDAQNSRGETILMLASQYGHTEIVRFLLAQEATSDLKDYQGQTALDRAKAWEHTDVIRLLTEYGAK